MRLKHQIGLNPLWKDIAYFILFIQHNQPLQEHENNINHAILAKQFLSQIFASELEPKLKNLNPKLCSDTLSNIKSRHQLEDHH